MEDKVGSSKEVIPSAKADIDSVDVMYYGAYCWCNIVWSLKIKLWTLWWWHARFMWHSRKDGRKMS